MTCATGGIGIGPQREPTSPSIGGPRGDVLLVEDDPSTARVLGTALSRAGHDVRVTPSIETAVKEIAASLPDVVVLDLVLTDGHGFDLLRRIRSTHSWVPVVLISGAATDETLHEGLTIHGADDFIRKPVVPNELMARVAARLRLRSHSAALRDYGAHARGGQSPDIVQPVSRLKRCMQVIAIDPVCDRVMRELLLSDVPPQTVLGLATRLACPAHVIKYHWQRHVAPHVGMGIKAAVIFARRLRLQELLNAGLSPLEASSILGVDESTAYRDLRSPCIAQAVDDWLRFICGHLLSQELTQAEIGVWLE